MSVATSPPVTRFAPSPTGLLHLGHAFSALTAWHAARSAGGTFLLRIEDIDAGRSRPHFTQAIIEDLSWLGLDWYGPVRRQSAHLPEYRLVLERLAARGLIYPCFCTRAEIAREVAAIDAAPHGIDGVALYPGTCRAIDPALRDQRIERGDQHAWRLDMARAAKAVADPLWCEEVGSPPFIADPAPLFGDVVLARKDAPASYHLCVAHDDAIQRVTLVTRAEDLKPATHLHRLLQALIGWPVPRWSHHALVLDQDGQRLSKRSGAPAIRDLRAQGHSAAGVRRMAGFA